MASSLSIKYHQREFASGSMKNAYDKMRASFPGKGWQVVIKAEYKASDGITSARTLKSTDLSTITSIGKSPKTLSFQGFRNNRSDVFVMFQSATDPLYLGVNGIDANQCRALHKIFVNELSLSTFQEESPLTRRNDPSSRVTEPIAVPSGEILAPEKLTAKWLWEYMPWKGWIFILGVFSSVFILGLKLGEFRLFTKVWKIIFDI